MDSNQNPYASPEITRSSFRQAQWRVLLATMFCYLFFYTGRQTFGFAIPGIERELGLSKPTLGWISALMLWAYAFGQAINGNLGDKFGGRRLVSLGAWLSCGLNWLVSFGQGRISLAVPWALNGYAQSLAWAPASKVLSNWWSKADRGKVYGAYVFSAGMSSVIAFATSLLITSYEWDWRWIFRVPVLSMLIGGTLYYVLVRDRPQDEGFSPQGEPQERDANTHSAPAEMETSWQRYRAVLSHYRFLLACVAIGFQNMARYGLLIWVPVHFLGTDWKESGSHWISIALPIGMALGAITSGWVSDQIFHGNRSIVISLCMFLAAGCSVAMIFVDRSSWVGIPLLFLTGFFAYGPQSAFWALCPDLLGRQHAGTGTGVMNTFAYLFAGLGEPLIGWLIESQNNTSIVFWVVAVVCIASATLAVFIRR